MSSGNSLAAPAGSASRRFLYNAGLILALLFLAPSLCVAQVLYGSLVGNVVDPSGGAVPGAKVTVTQQQTGFSRSVSTDQAGGYSITTLTPGTYSVKISATGFKAFERTEVRVALNTVSRVDAAMELGAVNQTVEVSGTEAPLLQTERADVHHELNAQTIENVPMPPGNNFEELFRAVPGFNPPVSAHSVATNPSRSLQFNVNGASSYGNDVRVDGVSQYNIWVPENTAYIPSSDAIETVNVATNNFTPEQGLAGGSSINVEIKSGTNQLHGDIYEYHYDNGIESRPYFFKGRNPKDIFNQFGGSVGGPIKKDKLFYFSNLELTRQRQFASSNTNTVPTTPMINGDMSGLTLGPFDPQQANPDVIYDPATGNPDGSGRTQIFSTNNPADIAHYNALCGSAQCLNMIPTSRISPVAAKLMSMMPAPNDPNDSSNAPNNNYLSAARVAFNRLTSDSKIDWNATNKLSMYGHFGYANFNTLNPQIFGAVGGPQASGFIGNEGQAFGHTITLSTTGNYVLHPNFVIAASFGFTRMTVNSEQLDVNTTPGTDILGIPGVNGTRKFEGSWPEFDIGNSQGSESTFSNLGTQHNFMPYFRNDPQFNYATDISWIKGTHTVRFGFNIIAQHLNQQQPEWNGGGSSYGPQGGFLFQTGPTSAKCTVAAPCVGGGTKGNSASNAYNNFATFLLGLDTSYGKNIQVPDFFHTITHEYGFYVGDQWQTTSKLTTTLGVRWEWYPMPTRGPGRGLERFDFSNNNTLLCGVGGNPIDCGTTVSKKYFAPRVGLAYRFTNTFVARAGYGITYEPYNVVDNLRTNYPILIPLFVSSPSALFASGVLDATSLQNTPAGQCTAFAISCPGGTLPIGIPLPATPDLTQGSIPVPGNVAVATAPDSLKRGYIQSWNFTLEKDIGSGWVLQAGYVASRTVNQLGILNENVQDPTKPAGCNPALGNCGGITSLPFGYNSKNTALCPTTSSTALGCRTAATSLIVPITNNHYDSLQAMVQHHFASGYLVQVNYTWSKTIGMGGVENEKSQPFVKLPEFYYLNRGLAPIDRPQNLEATFVAESPFGSGKHWVTSGFGSKLLGGWQISGLVSAVSGSVFEVTASGTSLNASGNDQRPDIVKPSVSVTGAVGPGTTWFDTSAFAGVNAQRFGTSAFYPLHGPGVFNFDAGLQRSFKLTERMNLLFRVQAINSTNTPHFSNPSGSCGSLTATGGCSNSSFGQVSSTTNLARDGIDQKQYEFSMKLNF